MYSFLKLEELLSSEKVNWDHILGELLALFDCTSGTIHRASEDEKVLLLLSSIHIPEFLIPKIKEIPVGKGVAGIAAERRKPVDICNLQTDESGVARPAAKETKMQGSIAVPILKNDRLLGVFGIAKPVPHEFGDEEMKGLQQVADLLAELLVKV